MFQEHFAKPAVGAIIEGSVGGEKAIVIQRRCKSQFKGGNVYEIPGGKIREFENIFECLRREVLEETGLTLTHIEGEASSSILESDYFKVLQYEPFSSTQNTSGCYPIMQQVFICQAEGQLLDEGDESQDIHWMPLTELKTRIETAPETFFTMDLGILKKYLRVKGL